MWRHWKWRQTWVVLSCTSVSKQSVKRKLHFRFLHLRICNSYFETLRQRTEMIETRIHIFQAPDWKLLYNPKEYYPGRNNIPERSACLWFWVAQKLRATADERDERTTNTPCISYRAIQIQSFGLECRSSWITGFQPVTKFSTLTVNIGKVRQALPTPRQ